MDMQDIENKYNKLIIQIPVFLGIALALGIGIGFMISMPRKNTVSEQSSKITEVLSLIQNNYVDSLGLDSTANFAIQKMLQNLDPHSSYFPADDAPLAKSQLETDFEGVGIEYELVKDTLFVLYPAKNGPADKAGILAGDKVIAINNENLTPNITQNTLFKKLRGKKGTSVELTILRGKSIQKISVTRDKIRSYSVYAYVIGSDIGFIKVSKFAEKTDLEFIEALKKLVEKDKVKKIIIDLRDNGGGFMDRATKIADEFLETGEMIVYTKGKHKRYDQEYLATKGGMFEKGDVVLLIDEGTASASEILAGALQDNDRAIVVGRRSYGKGLVQVPFELSDGAEMRLTVSKYYSPSGRCIQRDYKNGKPYDKNLVERYKNGELLHQDSIHYDNKQVFKTKKGKKVYGGGGISPDYFIPLDTTDLSTSILNLMRENKLREHASGFAQNNKKSLLEMGLDKFDNDWQIDTNTFKSIVGNISMTTAQSNYLKLYYKSYLAKILWGNEAQIRIRNTQDKAVLKAIEVLK